MPYGGCFASRVHLLGIVSLLSKMGSAPKPAFIRQSPYNLLHHAHAPPNTALEATGHSAYFSLHARRVGVARASAWAFGISA